MIVRIRNEAEADLEAAFNYYEHRQKGLGVRFAHTFLHGVREIATAPNRWPHDATELDFRKYSLPPFPFKILYLIESDHCMIMAVADQRRRPGYWQDRI